MSTASIVALSCSSLHVPIILSRNRHMSLVTLFSRNHMPIVESGVVDVSVNVFETCRVCGGLVTVISFTD